MYQRDPKHTGNVGDCPSARREATLMIRRCECCGQLLAPLFDVCSSCRSADLAWVPCSGTGSVVSWRVLQRAANPRAEVERSTIAIVELDEGPWLYTMIHGELPPSSTEPVRVRFRARSRGDRFPVFAVNREARASDARPQPA
jgi:uncharacterized protein